MAGVHDQSQQFVLILACLLTSLFIEYIPSASAEGHCVWYGVCRVNTIFRQYNYCSYNGSALPIEERSRPIIEKYCPAIAKGGVSCCNFEQLERMRENIMIAEALLYRCPSCMYNFLGHICGMTCGPNHSEYIEPVITPYNSTHQNVRAIRYYLSENYMQATYNSCAQVQFRSENQVTMDFMCGEYGSKYCTPKRWFEFMGSVEVPYVAFQINYNTESDPARGLTPYDPETRPSDVESPVCRFVRTYNSSSYDEYDYDSTSEHNLAVKEHKTTVTDKYNVKNKTVSGILCKITTMLLYQLWKCPK